MISISKHIEEIHKTYLKEEQMMRLFLPLDDPPQDLAILRKIFRQKLNISDGTVVFGRIGRNDNYIFDPISLLAFEKIVPLVGVVKLTKLENERPKAHKSAKMTNKRISINQKKGF
jgi:hypothetical protein